jgi:outer membrane protein
MFTKLIPLLAVPVVLGAQQMTPSKATTQQTVDSTFRPISLTEAVRLAKENNVGAITAANSVRSANLQIRSARAQLFPSVTGSLGQNISAGISYGGSGTGAYGLNSDPFPYSKGLNLRLNFPIFNQYGRENNIAQAQISAANAQAQIKDQRLFAQQTIITQIGLLRNDEEKIRVQQINIRASEEALRVNQQRYALGAGTLLDVLTSQSNLIIARQQLIQTRLDYRNARAQIEAFIGRDLP